MNLRDVGVSDVRVSKIMFCVIADVTTVYINCLNKWSMYYVLPMHYTGKFVVTCIWLYIFVIININTDET